MPELTVLIPTLNHATTLELCLDALAAQKTNADVQILVVDDGSTDRTARIPLRKGTELHSLSSSGHSGALNAGLRLARGDVVLFLDDDVLAAPGLLQRHLDHHRARPEPHEALAGCVTWAPQLPITHHMEWLEDGGPLFSFNTIEDPEDADWRHFCTANVSVKRSMLGDDPFDEELVRFTDAELGYRLARRGLRLRYDPAALGHHWRVDSPGSTQRRMRVVGQAARQVHVKHPAIAEAPPTFRSFASVHALCARAAAPLARRAGFLWVDDRVFAYDAARAYARGYAEQRGAGSV